MPPKPNQTVEQRLSAPAIPAPPAKSLEERLAATAPVQNPRPKQEARTAHFVSACNLTAFITASVPDGGDGSNASLRLFTNKTGCVEAWIKFRDGRHCWGELDHMEIKLKGDQEIGAFGGAFKFFLDRIEELGYRLIEQYQPCPHCGQ